jgi:hypothetical protein
MHKTIQRMPIAAACSHGGPALLIDARCDPFEMTRIAAKPCTTEMVRIQSNAIPPGMENQRNPMGILRAIIE